MKTYIFLSPLVMMALLITTLPANFVQAHGAGESLEKIVGEYKIDVGYDPVILEATSPAFFDFDLIINDTGERADFSDIWVRIIRGKQTVFASGIHKPDFGNTTVVYTFPEVGEYELNIRYQKEGEKIVEASFPLTVEAGANTSGSGFNFVWLILGIIGGAAGGFLTAFALKGTKQPKV